jgi:hypothetical protein
MIPSIPSKLASGLDLLQSLGSLLQHASNQADKATSVHRKDFESSADLSSRLTLDFYFAQMKRSNRGHGLRFDQISASSDSATLLRFVKEHGISISDEESSTSSSIYTHICASLAAPNPDFLKSINTKRVNPDFAPGKLKPMPRPVDMDGSEQSRSTSEVLKAYGAAHHKDDMHYSLSEALESMGVKYTTDFTIHNGQIHVDLIISSLDKTGQGAKVVLLAHDRGCFNEGTDQVNTHIGMKKKSLKAMGFKVVTVPFFDWEKLSTPGQRVAYIAGKLSRAGFWGEGGGVFGESGTQVKHIIRSVHHR